MEYNDIKNVIKCRVTAYERVRSVLKRVRMTYVLAVCATIDVAVVCMFLHNWENYIL